MAIRREAFDDLFKNNSQWDIERGIKRVPDHPVSQLAKSFRDLTGGEFPDRLAKELLLKFSEKIREYAKVHGQGVLERIAILTASKPVTITDDIIRVLVNEHLKDWKVFQTIARVNSDNPIDTLHGRLFLLSMLPYLTPLAPYTDTLRRFTPDLFPAILDALPGVLTRPIADISRQIRDGTLEAPVKASDMQTEKYFAFPFQSPFGGAVLVVNVDPHNCGIGIKISNDLATDFLYRVVTNSRPKG